MPYAAMSMVGVQFLVLPHAQSTSEGQNYGYALHIHDCISY